jgi:hypothetical protein
LVGPARTFTLSDFRLTNRGTGNPLPVPFPGCSAAIAAPAEIASIAPTAVRTHMLAIIARARPTPSKTPVNPAISTLARSADRAAVAALS